VPFIKIIASALTMGTGGSLVLEGEKVIGATTYSAVVIMVIVTTLVAPPLLKWTLTDRNAVTPPEDGA